MLAALGEGWEEIIRRSRSHRLMLMAAWQERTKNVFDVNPPMYVSSLAKETNSTIRKRAEYLLGFKEDAIDASYQEDEDTEGGHNEQ